MSNSPARSTNDDQMRNEGAPVDIPSTSGHSGTPADSFPELGSVNYDLIQKLTQGFSDELGEGGFGIVYSGKLQPSLHKIAVKLLVPTIDCLPREQLEIQYETEVTMLTRLKHPNIIDLIGYCKEGENRAIIYDFMPNKSLEDNLHDVPQWPALKWNARLKIAAGIAKALQFLHVEADPVVIFRDLKLSNVLLDAHFQPKLSDFGLALDVINDRNLGVTTEKLYGTPGYCAPEYAETCTITTKADVYSYGILLLELVTGKRPWVWVRDRLVDWVHCTSRLCQLVAGKNLHGLADANLNGKYTEADLLKLVDLALRCAAEEPSNRPTMSEVSEEVSSFLI